MSDMQEIVPIFKSTIDDNSANARDLYNFLEIGRDFSNWIKSKIQACDLEIGVDYIMEVFAKSGESGVVLINILYNGQYN